MAVFYAIEYNPSYDIYIVKRMPDGVQVFSTPYRFEAEEYKGHA